MGMEPQRAADSKYGNPSKALGGTLGAGFPATVPKPAQNKDSGGRCGWQPLQLENITGAGLPPLITIEGYQGSTGQERTTMISDPCRQGRQRCFSGPWGREGGGEKRGKRKVEEKKKEDKGRREEALACPAPQVSSPNEAPASLCMRAQTC